MTRYMVRCDMEGIGGIVSDTQAEPGGKEYAFGQRAFMSELLALCDGLRAGGADEVVIYDEHYYGRNIALDQLPGHVNAICGKPPYRTDWAGGLDHSFAGLILLGFHSKAGTPGGLLAHSYEPDIRDIHLNGVSVGEIGLEAAVAGDWGVPVALMIGDSAGAAEAEALLPGLPTVVVKESLSETGALCYAEYVVAERVRKAAERIARAAPKVAPWRVRPPVRLEVSLSAGAYRDAVCRRYPEQMRDGAVAVLEGNSVTAVWSDYWQMKLAAQRDLGGAA